MKSEGLAFPPFPLQHGRRHENATPTACHLRDANPPRCEMCGAEVIATHCKRICLKCGFMTGCSEGI
jgi:hypothetical protein